MSSSSSFYEKVLTGTESFSLTHKMSHQLAKWDSSKNAHVIKKISVRILGVITLPFLGVIDTVAHATMFAGKLGLGICLLPPNMVITLINRKSVHPDLTLTSATVHLNLFMQGCVHTLTLWIVVFFSPAKAAAISGKITIDNEKSKQTITNLTKEVQEANKKNKVLTDEVADASCKVKNLNDEVKNLNDQKDQLQIDKDALDVQVGNLNADKVQLQNDLNVRNNENANLNAQVGNLNAQNATKQSEIVAKAAEIMRLGDEIVALNGQITQLQDDLNVKNPDLQRLSNENNTLNGQVAQLQSTLNARDGENANLNAQVLNLTQQNAEKQSEISTNVADIKVLSQLILGLNVRIAELTADNQNLGRERDNERTEKQTYIELNKKLDENNNELIRQTNTTRPLPKPPAATPGSSSAPVQSQKPIPPPPLPRDVDPEIKQSLQNLTEVFKELNSDQSSDLKCMPLLTESQIKYFNEQYSEIKLELKNPQIDTKIRFNEKKRALDECIEYFISKSICGYDPANVGAPSGLSIINLPAYDKVVDELVEQIKEAIGDFGRQKPLMINLARYLNYWYEKLGELQREMGAAKQKEVKQFDAAQEARQALFQAKKDQDLTQWRKIFAENAEKYRLNIDSLSIVDKGHLFQMLRKDSALYPHLLFNFSPKDRDATMNRIKEVIESIFKTIPLVKPQEPGDNSQEHFWSRYRDLVQLIEAARNILNHYK